MKVAFVYANSRAARIPKIAAGIEPDTSLLGQNHLAAHDLDATIAEPLLQRVQPRSQRLARIAWTTRELTLPWELHGADVVCTTFGPLVALAARLRPGLRTILLNIDLCTRLERASKHQRMLLAASVCAADAVVCFADAQRERLLEQTGVDGSRVHFLPLGVDERFLAPERPPPAAGHVLVVGRDLARDYTTLAAAAAGLECPVVLVASEKNLIGVELPTNVSVQLDVSALELRTLYEQARCVVIPTRAESFRYGADCSGQTVVLDAFAMARPVVTSRRATLHGYVEHERNALVVDPEEPYALRAAIERVVRDHDLSIRLGAEGRKEVERRFTTRALAANLAALIKAVGTSPR